MVSTLAKRKTSSMSMTSKLAKLERQVAKNTPEVLQRSYVIAVSPDEKNDAIQLINLVDTDGDEIRLHKIVIRWTPTARAESWGRMFSLNQGYGVSPYNSQSSNARKYYDLEKTKFRSWAYTDFSNLPYGGASSREMTLKFNIPMKIGLFSNTSDTVFNNQIYFDSYELATVFGTSVPVNFYVSVFYTDN